MQKPENLSKNSSLRLTPQQSLRRLGLCSQITTGQQTSLIVFPKKRSRLKASSFGNISTSNDDSKKATTEEHRIDIGDEHSDLLGYDVFSGKLVLDKRKPSKTDVQAPTSTASRGAVDDKLTSKALVWATQMLHLEDLVLVSISFFTMKNSRMVKKGK
ncbi:hypothetical protein M9H77_19202 [Catharanthus roseus]|uniref:Uncharacterized protein n=1 Tax=Catharanthus roseus TaxID=4058 RepID=A0ACC0B9K4_CATRO|nr:hypothetical protein M9H77_19202 [Catharanthus roseus]